MKRVFITGASSGIGLATSLDAAKAGAPLSREPLAGLKAQVAERIRADVEQMAIPHAASTSGRVTVSVGVASCVPEEDNAPETLVKAAARSLSTRSPAEMDKATSSRASVRAGKSTYSRNEWAFCPKNIPSCSIEP